LSRFAGRIRPTTFSGKNPRENATFLSIELQILLFVNLGVFAFRVEPSRDPCVRTQPMKFCSLASLIIISLDLFACEKQPVQPPLTSPTPKDSSNTTTSSPGISPSRGLVQPLARAEASASPQLQKTLDDTKAAPTPSAPAESTPSPQESNTPSDATLLAGGRPVFKNQAANDYLESYDAYIKDFKEAYREMKQGNMAKYEAVIARIEELQAKGEQVQKELSSEEQRVFSEYIDRKAQELGQSDQN
jgi:hypothetical protein